MRLYTNRREEYISLIKLAITLSILDGALFDASATVQNIPSSARNKNLGNKLTVNKYNLFPKVFNDKLEIDS